MFEQRPRSSCGAPVRAAVDSAGVMQCGRLEGGLQGCTSREGRTSRRAAIRKLGVLGSCYAAGTCNVVHVVMAARAAALSSCLVACHDCDVTAPVSVWLPCLRPHSRHGRTHLPALVHHSGPLGQAGLKHDGVRRLPTTAGNNRFSTLALRA